MTKYQIKISNAQKVGLMLVLAFIGVLIYYKITGTKDPYYQLKDNYAPQDVWALFKDNKISDLAAFSTDRINTSNPVTSFSCDNRQYFITVVKMKVPKDRSLKQLVLLTDQNSFNVDGIPYSVYTGPHHVRIKMGNIKPEHITATLNGYDTDTIANNKLMMVFHSEVHTFFVNDEKSDTTAIWANSDEHSIIATSIMPIEVAFIKHSDQLYIVVMLLGDNNIAMKIPENTLVNLLKQPDLN
jgi:hypothetical protein